MNPDGRSEGPISLLVHLCCAPDAAHGVPELSARHRVAGFFFNPNIHPEEEARRRLGAARRLAALLPHPLLVGSGGQPEWEEATRGLAEEPERRARCEACIRVRLFRTAREAKAMGIPAFSTVLTVSPKKDAAMVNRVGREVAAETGVGFVEADLKKNDGFRRSVEASRRLGLYRQNYCGCRYSFREGAGVGRGWRKREGIEPPGDIAASRPDLKSGRATSAPSASVPTGAGPEGPGGATSTSRLPGRGASSPSPCGGGAA